jgi:hypothetical protein
MRQSRGFPTQVKPRGFRGLPVRRPGLYWAYVYQHPLPPVACVLELGRLPGKCGFPPRREWSSRATCTSTGLTDLACAARNASDESIVKTASPDPAAYDVVIVGGALAGAASAILLKREAPGARVLILEKSTVFGRRVGEATVEISGFFLGRVLGLTQHLNESHLVKQGMRFWFYNERTRELPDCSEIGGRYLSRVPAYQVDRAVLDEEILRRAIGLGVEVNARRRSEKSAWTPVDNSESNSKRMDSHRKFGRAG